MIPRPNPALSPTTTKFRLVVRLAFKSAFGYFRAIGSALATFTVLYIIATLQRLTEHRKLTSHG